MKCPNVQILKLELFVKTNKYLTLYNNFQLYLGVYNVHQISPFFQNSLDFEQISTGV